MRWLKSAVIGMGLLIMIGLTVVIVTVVRRAGTPAPQAAGPASGRPSPPVIGAPVGTASPARALDSFGETRIALPPGASIRETVVQGDRLVVRLRQPNGDDALLLIDARTGRKLGLIRLERRPRQ